MLESQITALPEKTVHLIEPDKAVRDSIKIMLESFNVKVSTYSTGRSFFTNASLSEYDYVLVENQLPDMTGLKLCEKLKNNGSNAALVLLTSVNDTAFEKINQSDVTAILQKPINSNKLLDTLNRL